MWPLELLAAEHARIFSRTQDARHLGDVSRAKKETERVREAAGGEFAKAY